MDHFNHIFIYWVEKVQSTHFIFDERVIYFKVNLYSETTLENSVIFLLNSLIKNIISLWWLVQIFDIKYSITQIIKIKF